MIKWRNGQFYVSARSRDRRPSPAPSRSPVSGNATAARLGESGTVPIAGGLLSDQFADGNAIHIYRIDGGSTCGLA